MKSLTFEQIEFIRSVSKMLWHGIYDHSKMITAYNLIKGSEEIKIEDINPKKDKTDYNLLKSVIRRYDMDYNNIIL